MDFPQFISSCFKIKINGCQIREISKIWTNVGSLGTGFGHWKHLVKIQIGVIWHICVLNTNTSMSTRANQTEVQNKCSSEKNVAYCCCSDASWTIRSSASIVKKQARIIFMEIDVMFQAVQGMWSAGMGWCLYSEKACKVNNAFLSGLSQFIDFSRLKKNRQLNFCSLWLIDKIPEVTHFTDENP